MNAMTGWASISNVGPRQDNSKESQSLERKVKYARTDFDRKRTLIWASGADDGTFGKIARGPCAAAERRSSFLPCKKKMYMNILDSQKAAAVLSIDYQKTVRSAWLHRQLSVPRHSAPHGWVRAGTPKLVRHLGRCMRNDGSQFAHLPGPWRRSSSSSFARSYPSHCWAGSPLERDKSFTSWQKT